MKQKVQSWQLEQRQGLDLDLKIKMSKLRIKEWYKENKGNVYVAFSGGKDSTVLLHLVRSIYPNVIAVFVDTGLEYPEIKEFVKEFDNILVLIPKMNFTQIIEQYGFPVVSKSVSMSISRYRNTKSPVQKRLRLNGGINPSSGKVQKMGVIPKKYHYLIDAPFKISEKCCDVMKKAPFKKFEKESKLQPFIGTMAKDSSMRKIQYLKNGCNSFEKGKSMPISFWTEKDIWEYIKSKDLNYCSVYDTGVSNTGCMFCMFGVGYDGCPNRFQCMEKSHPSIYNYCINKLGLKEILEFMGVEYKNITNIINDDAKQKHGE